MKSCTISRLFFPANHGKVRMDTSYGISDKSYPFVGLARPPKHNLINREHGAQHLYRPSQPGQRHNMLLFYCAIAICKETVRTLKKELQFDIPFSYRHNTKLMTIVMEASFR